MAGADYKAMVDEQILGQLTELRNSLDTTNNKLDTTNENVNKLSLELTKTTTMIRDYNGLRETIQTHDRKISEFSAFQNGYKEAKNVNSADQDRKQRRLSLGQNWGALAISLTSLAITGAMLFHHA